MKYQHVQAVCNGDYQTSHGHSFCYLDDDGNEQLTEGHRKFLEKRNLEENRGYVAYHADDTAFEKPLIFDTKRELCYELGIDASHVEEVCKGERQHINRFRIAYWDKKMRQPVFEESHRNPIRKQFRRVICLDDERVFDSQGDAAKEYGLDPQQIKLCCEGVLKSTGRSNGKPRRFAFVDDDDNTILTEKHEEPLGWTRTRFFCVELKKPYFSVAEFSRETGVPAKRVRKHLDDPEVDLDGYHLVRL